MNNSLPVSSPALSAPADVQYGLVEAFSLIMISCGGTAGYSGSNVCAAGIAAHKSFGQPIGRTRYKYVCGGLLSDPHRVNSCSRLSFLCLFLLCFERSISAISTETPI